MFCLETSTLLSAAHLPAQNVLYFILAILFAFPLGWLSWFLILSSLILWFYWIMYMDNFVRLENDTRAKGLVMIAFSMHILWVTPLQWTGHPSCLVHSLASCAFLFFVTHLLPCSVGSPFLYFVAHSLLVYQLILLKDIFWYLESKGPRVIYFLKLVCLNIFVGECPGQYLKYFLWDYQFFQRLFFHLLSIENKVLATSILDFEKGVQS